ncbi:MAG: aminodeoxychorismate/anthranilate synthase component II [Candidatus Marinimicrobia bacterium]|nr:aminodeoxychorismate/anthranilate synthase component II [Candidatus Neomarinimicrobiota bacterium]
MNVLFIDNFDSFTYNLAEEFAKRSNDVLVYRNNTPLTKIDQVIDEFNPGVIVLSPGPSNPKKAGICLELIKKYYNKIPLFGICLGFQCIVEAFDGKISQCREIFHGKASIIKHNEEGFFKNIENPIQVGRYHSLFAAELPPNFTLASEIRGIPMAIWHNKHPIYGVQFHPESILTPVGGKIIENIIGGIND